MGCFDRNNNVAVEYVYYRKVGDHATNMPNNVYFRNKKGDIHAIKENIKYTYDKLGRLILEKDLYKNIFLKMRLGRVKCFQINRFYGTIYRKDFQEGTE